MKNLIAKYTTIASIALCALITPLLANASTQQSATPKPPAQAMMIGLFHFANPKADVVKIDKQIDVMEESSQAYLDAFAMRVAETYKPTRVLLEYNPENDATMQQRYQDYLAGNYELPVNETYQIGFRLAKAAGGVPIASYDERNVPWQAGPLFAKMKSDYPELDARMQQLIKDITAEMSENQRTMSLEELLLQHNDPEFDRGNRATYLMTNAVGVDDQFEGAIAAASWWQRNFHMYAKIQKYATPGERLFVVGGQGHTAILKQFLATDNDLVGVDVRPFLKTTQ